MSEDSPSPSASAEAVRAALKTADHRRRAREASVIVWRVAPFVAGAALALALVRRWTLWPAALPLIVLVAGGIALALYVFATTRPHDVPDETAALIDADAGLRGELRSASWFARRASLDDWADHHLERAATRLDGVDWSSLYPASKAPRARLSTAVMVIAALALTIVLPARVVPGRTASAATPADQKPPQEPRTADGVVIPPELLEQLQALLAAAAAGDMQAADRLASSAELRDLLNKLAADPDLLKKLAEALAAKDPLKAASAKDLKDLAERARKASELASMSQDMRDALEKMAEQADQADADQAARKEDGEAAAEAGEKGESAQSNSAGSMQDLSVQMSRQADAGGAAGIMMMANPEDQSSGPPGSGVGGSGSQDTAAAAAAALAAAFSHETVEASRDNPGDNVETEVRRMTEQGTSSVAFTHGASAQFDKSRAAAPPPVPEARRSGVQTYFVRKQ